MTLKIIIKSLNGLMIFLCLLSCHENPKKEFYFNPNYQNDLRIGESKVKMISSYYGDPEHDSVFFNSSIDLKDNGALFTDSLKVVQVSHSGMMVHSLFRIIFNEEDSILVDYISRGCSGVSYNIQALDYYEIECSWTGEVLQGKIIKGGKSFGHYKIEVFGEFKIESDGRIMKFDTNGNRINTFQP